MSKGKSRATTAPKALVTPPDVKPRYQAMGTWTPRALRGYGRKKR